MQCGRHKETLEAEGHDMKEYCERRRISPQKMTELFLDLTN